MNDRVVWGTRDYRASDLMPGDVVRDRYGKWDLVEEVTADDRYVRVKLRCGSHIEVRDVALVSVQHAKPS